jgi:RNA polymerase sigma-70 factor (family 1)
LPPYNDDTRLSAALAKDDVRAFDALYHKYYNAVLANIFKLIKQQEAAEDVLQDVFAALWENRKKVDRERSVGGWLFVVSHNKALKFLQGKVREKILAQEEMPEEITEQEENEHIQLEYQSSLINEAIKNLSPQKKLVFTLCKLEGKTYQEAAEVLGISPHTVKEYVSDALKFIRTYSLRQYTLRAPLSLSLLITFLKHL